ncbi:MAG: YihA family ribosome biogenesis GTP-binding protein [Chitinophagales bacterium]|nr:YihA family ribosome biogenesis GTP-binding protein [Chitinophagales bacterium]HMV14697.1 ribosome biogenesis GTP-binding protein YihA/YsxC [Chitinophagales bacterium]HMW11818.1 ribosome biogenesis GTP-binding protein YihA/YsxC [Chitinophagales bacterium]HMX59053.1 ribosome biogenesis GTP-binding protein YihA/YsxC [Chitinophagales bacterium]HMY24305.1 ribosome biogenesis GTP-binding protein YihA/YsxC [Chitinophagales bacterium]
MIQSAKFIGAFPKTDDCPTTNLSEFAFIGRSNVGKSSLINLLTNRKDLAKVSKTPGKTQTINFFLIDESWYLVDLPGYGYARVSKSTREVFSKMIKYYISHREQLLNLFVLIDATITPQKIDLDFINWLGEMRIPFSIIFTKTDRDKTLAIQKNVKLFKQKMLESWTALPPMFLTSSEKNRGGKEVIDFIKNSMSEEETDI